MDASATSSDETRVRRGPRALGFVLGSVGLAGVGTGVLMNVWGRKDNNVLAELCSNLSARQCEPRPAAVPGR
jgi:hypothetical protein